MQFSDRWSRKNAIRRFMDVNTKQLMYAAIRTMIYMKIYLDTTYNTYLINKMLIDVILTRYLNY